MTTKPKITYSNAWCVCLAGLLEDGHDKWPILFGSGDPTHWCPTCYDESLIEQRQEAEDDDDLEYFLANPGNRVERHALDAAILYDLPNDTCDRGHKPPKDA